MVNTSLSHQGFPSYPVTTRNKLRVLGHDCGGRKRPLSKRNMGSISAFRVCFTLLVLKVIESTAGHIGLCFSGGEKTNGRIGPLSMGCSLLQQSLWRNIECALWTVAKSISHREMKQGFLGVDVFVHPQYERLGSPPIYLFASGQTKYETESEHIIFSVPSFCGG